MTDRRNENTTKDSSTELTFLKTIFLIFFFLKDMYQIFSLFAIVQMIKILALPLESVNYDY